MKNLFSYLTTREKAVLIFLGGSLIVGATVRIVRDKLETRELDCPSVTVPREINAVVPREMTESPAAGVTGRN